jgi:hypothetical protein
MARTFTCNEEIIVVSKGTENIGKMAMLGDGGKFDPSVIPTVEKQDTICRVTRSTAQSIPNSAHTEISFDTVEFDSDNIYDNANPTKLVVPSDGIYQVMSYVVFAISSSAGVRFSGIRVNGSTFIAGQTSEANAVNGVGLNCGTICKFKKGDYIELDAFQVSTGALNVTSDSAGIPSLSIYKISD